MPIVPQILTYKSFYDKIIELAIVEGRKRIIEFIIDAYVSRDEIIFERNCSVFMYLASIVNKSLDEVINEATGRLIELGAPVDQIDENGRSVLSYIACSKTHFNRPFVLRFITINSHFRSNVNAFTFELATGLFESRKYAVYHDNPFRIAIISENHEVLKLFIEHHGVSSEDLLFALYANKLEAAKLIESTGKLVYDAEYAKAFQLLMQKINDLSFVNLTKDEYIHIMKHFNLLGKLKTKIPSLNLKIVPRSFFSSYDKLTFEDKQYGIKFIEIDLVKPKKPIAASIAELEIEMVEITTEKERLLSEVTKKVAEELDYNESWRGREENPGLSEILGSRRF